MTIADGCAVMLPADEALEWFDVSAIGQTALEEPSFDLLRERSIIWSLGSVNGHLGYFGIAEFPRVREGYCMWLVTTNVFTSNPFSSMRVVRYWLRELMNKYPGPFWCYAAVSDPKRSRFLSHLGFNRVAWTLAPDGSKQYIYKRG